MLFKRGRIWWFRIKFAGSIFRESSRSTSKDIARRAERQRRREVEEGYHRLSKRQPLLTLATAADKWLDSRSIGWSPSTLRISAPMLSRLKPFLGSALLTEIGADDVAGYQRNRLRAGASPKTINLEIGTLRAVLRRHRLWANLQPDIQMLQVREEHGKSLSTIEQESLLVTCAASRSLALLPAIVLALNTGMRYREILTLQWRDVALDLKRITVRESKTEAGTRRVIPLNAHAVTVLQIVGDRFPLRQPGDFVFCRERYGLAGDRADVLAYGSEPKVPISSLKEAWESAKRASGIVCRFHDLRHTAATRVLRRSWNAVDGRCERSRLEPDDGSPNGQALRSYWERGPTSCCWNAFRRAALRGFR